MPAITLPDGNIRSFDHPVSVYDVAANIGPGLAKAALGGVVDGHPVDTSFVIDHDAALAIITSGLSGPAAPTALVLGAAVATMAMPHVMPLGFHGCFVPA